MKLYSVRTALSRPFDIHFDVREGLGMLLKREGSIYSRRTLVLQAEVDGDFCLLIETPTLWLTPLLGLLV